MQEVKSASSPQLLRCHAVFISISMPRIHAIQRIMQHIVAREQLLQRVLLQATCRRLTFSSMKFRQPSLGTKAAIFFPFLISWTPRALPDSRIGLLGLNTAACSHHEISVHGKT